jgi:ABC-2 type transport system ATP-binding protein
VLELVNVKKYFKDNRAVDGISFFLKEGEILGLIGANGAGKSTTISMIATLIRPDSGYIYYNGQDIVKHPGIMRSSLGYVPQEVALYPSLSGKDNLIFWGKANHVRGKKLNQRIVEVSKIINLSEDVLNRKVSSYSGGMKRRLNIGAALLHEPKLVIMDEPTVGLDVESRNQILEAVTALKHQGAGIIYAGHYLEEMEKLCDKFCIIDRGKCILFGDKATLLAGKSNLEQLYLEGTKRAAVLSSQELLQRR